MMATEDYLAKAALLMFAIHFAAPEIDLHMHCLWL